MYKHRDFSVPAIPATLSRAIPVIRAETDSETDAEMGTDATMDATAMDVPLP